VGISDLEAGITPHFPTVAVDSHHTLEVGDVRFELFDFTGLHSDSDILILVPEESMLFTGDVFWGGRLPILGDMTSAGFNRLMENWNAILEMSPDLSTMVPGHSDVPLTVADFNALNQYVSRLWADVQVARQAGTDLVRFLMQHSLKERYPEVADYTYIIGDYNVHQHNVYMLWQAVGG
jgi:glyoxylase-like metal-dependent hydrolase (beta-lactamase superfamily II)